MLDDSKRANQGLHLSMRSTDPVGESHPVLLPRPLSTSSDSAAPSNPFTRSTPALEPQTTAMLFQSGAQAVRNAAAARSAALNTAKVRQQFAAPSAVAIQLQHHEHSTGLLTVAQSRADTISSAPRQLQAPPKLHSNGGQLPRAPRHPSWPSAPSLGTIINSAAPLLQ